MVHTVLALAAIVVVTAGPIEADYDHASHANVRHADSHEMTFKSFNAFEVDDARFEIDGDEIILSHLEAPNEEIRLTADYRMFVDDDEVKLTPEQKKTVEEFYKLSFEIRGEIKAIAKEGVKIGVKGAELGLKAVGCVFKMLLTGYDEEDLDAEMELEGDKLEAYAERLEVRAEALEDRVDLWEELGRQMKDEVPALQKMDWL